MPLFHPADEVVHYHHVCVLRHGEERSLNSYADDTLRDAVWLAGARGFQYMIDVRPQQLRDAIPPQNLPPVRSIWGYQNYQPPLYYFLASRFISSEKHPLVHHGNTMGLRCVNVLLFLAAGWFWAKGLSGFLNRPALLFPLLALLWSWAPTCIFRVSNDILVHFIGGLTFFAAFGLPAPPPLRRVLVSLMAVACVLTKYNLVYLFLPFLFLSLAARAVRERGVRPVLPEVATPAIAATVALAVLAWDNLGRFGSYTGSALVRAEHGWAGVHPFWYFFQPHTLQYMASTLLFGETPWHALRLSFHWVDESVVALEFLIGGGLLAALAVTGRAAWQRDPDVLPVAAVVTGLVLMVLIQAILMNQIPGIWFQQGRLLVPFLPPAVALAFEGYFRQFPSGSSLQRHIFPALLTVAWIVVHESRLLRFIALMESSSAS